MGRLWSTEDIIGQDDRELLFWHHRLNYCSFKYLLRISRRGIIFKNISKVRKLPPCVSCSFGKSHKRTWSTKSKHSNMLIRNTSDTRHGAMASIDHKVSSQTGIIPQVTGDLTHAIF